MADDRYPKNPKEVSLVVPEHSDSRRMPESRQVQALVIVGLGSGQRESHQAVTLVRFNPPTRSCARIPDRAI